MNKNKKFYLAKTKVQPNTFIGGVSATINTAALAASKLGISASRIKAFSVIGDNIQFAVTGGSYSLPNAAFQSNTAITYYYDLDGLMTAILGNGFSNSTNLKYVKLKNVTSLPINCFSNCKLEGLDNDLNSVTSLNGGAFRMLASGLPTVINLPALTSINGTLNFDGHASLSNNVTFNLPVSFKTSNSGLPHSQIVLSTMKSTIVNYIGYTDDAIYNTELGGYGSVYANKGLLANFLGIGSGAIVNYHSVSSDLRIQLLVSSYQIRNFQDNTIITHYYDLDGLATSIAANGFLRAINCKNVKIKNVTSLPIYCFQASGFIGNNSDFSSVTTTSQYTFFQSAFVTTITLPVVTNLGGSVANNQIFEMMKTGAIITVPIALQTANAGAPDGDLVYASGTRGATIIYI